MPKANIKTEEQTKLHSAYLTEAQELFTSELAPKLSQIKKAIRKGLDLVGCAETVEDAIAAIGALRPQVRGANLESLFDDVLDDLNRLRDRIHEALGTV